MQKFSELINGSMEWATTVTFRPFKPKKWLILGFVALMAGYVSGGGRLNLPNPYSPKENKKIESKSTPQASVPQSSTVKKSEPTRDDSAGLGGWFPQNINTPIIISFIAVLIFLFLGFIVVMMWLSARFDFIFLEDVVKNDASIVTPFKKHKKIGNSLFLFSLVFTAIFVAILGIIGFAVYLFFAKSGISHHPSGPDILKIIFVVAFLGIVLLALIFIAMIIGVIVRDFVTIIMLKDQMKIMPAWEKAWALVKKNKGDVVLYFLLKMGLGIVSSLIYSALFMAALFGLILTMVPIGAILYLVYQVVPAAGHVLFFVMLAVLGLPVLLFLWYCALCAFLPFAVFFRTLSVKFFGRLAPEYNLFRVNSEVIV